MAGALLHWAMGDPEKMDPGNPAYTDSFRKAYTIGLLLPDIAKRGLIRDREDFGRFWEGCSEGDILTYEDYLAFRKNNHFSPNKQNPSQQDTRNPNLTEFVNAEFVDMRKAVWQGVLCHLLGDKVFYHEPYCVDFVRVREDYLREAGAIEKWDEDRWGSSRTSKVYYNDYNLLNPQITAGFGLKKNIPVPERLRKTRLYKDYGFEPENLISDLYADMDMHIEGTLRHFSIDIVRGFVERSADLCIRELEAIESGRGHIYDRYEMAIENHYSDKK